MANVKLLVDIEANSARLVSEMEKGRKSLDGIKKSADSMSSALSIIKIDSLVNLGRQAFNTGQQIYNLAKQTVDWADDLQDAAKAIGLTVAELWKWQYISKTLGVDQQQFNLGIRTFINNMADAKKGTGEASEIFKKAQITSSDLNTAFMQGIKYLSGMKDGAERAGDSMKLFGSRSGMVMLEIADLGEEGIAKLVQHMKDMGYELDPNKIEKLANLKPIFTDLAISAKMFVIEMQPAISALGEFLKYANESVLLGNLLGQRVSIQLQKDQVQQLYQLKLRLKELKAEGGSPEAIASFEKQIKDLQGRFEPVTPTKPAKPTIPSKGAELTPEQRTIIGEERNQYEKDYWENMHKTWAIEDKIKSIEGDRAQALADDMFPSMDKVTRIQEQMTEGGEKLRVKLVEMRGLVIDFGWEDYASGALQASSAGERAMNKLKIANEKAATAGRVTEESQKSIAEMTRHYGTITGNIELQIQANTLLLNIERERIKNMEGIAPEQRASLLLLTEQIAAQEQLKLTGTAGQGMAAGFKDYVNQVGNAYTQMKNMTNSLTTGMEGAFSNFFVSIFDKTKTWQEKMKGLFQGLANSFIKALSDMAAKALVSGLIKNLGGLFAGGSTVTAASGVESGAFSLAIAREGLLTKNDLLAHYPIHAYAGGGIANSPQFGIFGEGGGSGEAFVPLKSGKIPVEMGDEGRGGQTVIVFNNYAMDAESFEKWVRTKGSKGILGLIADDARAGGSMKSTIRGV